MSTEKKSWKEKLHLAPKFEEHTIAGETYRFWPISLKTACKLRVIATPLARALTALFQSGVQDAGQEIREFEEKTGATGKIMTVQPITVELAKLRMDQKRLAVVEMIDTLTDPKNALVVGEILCDSLRDLFDRDYDEQTVKEFMAELDIATLKEFLVGVGKANAQVFGPLGKALPSKISAALGSGATPEPAKAST